MLGSARITPPAPQTVRALIPALTFALLGLASSVYAQEHRQGPETGEKLGKVEFPVSCSAEARSAFERGAALLHSFFFEQADAAFDAVLAADPRCAMAYWGKAVGRMGNPFAGPPSAAASRAGLADVETGLALNPTERERGYLEAIATLYREYDKTDARTRRFAYEEAMRRLAERHPDDVEARIFYALIVIANAPPTDQTYERQMRAAKILEPLFRERPDHPGLAHYLIHAYDAPPIARGGLDAALRYASIAPSAPHALHMPSHIFTRLGMWDESIETNRRSADVERAPGRKAHPMDYMVYAYLQTGRDEAARRAVAEAARLADEVQGVIAYNFVAMPARYALERGRWAEAAGLEVKGALNTPAEAVTRFARGIGGARSGDANAARAEAGALARIRDALRAGGERDWAERVEAQRLAVEAWIARAEGRAEDALRRAEAAAAIEDQVEKHPVTPGPILPARELQGDLLLELGRPTEAVKAYEAALLREPNRARTLFGAARAAELAGRTEHAVRRYGEWLALMAKGDGTRPELAHAREFLGGR